MPRVLLLLPTATYRTQAFLDAARRIGVEVTVASEHPSTLSKLNPAGLLKLDFSDPPRAAHQAADFAAKHPIAAVVPVDDQVTVVAAAIAEPLGLPANSIESAAAARNKQRMRELLAKAGVPQPGFQSCRLDFASLWEGLPPAQDSPLAKVARDVHYPCVVKPLSLSGSQGVIRADDAEGFVQAVNRLGAILRKSAERSAESGEPENAGPPPTPHHSPPRELLVEDFVPGPEVALEGLLSRGRLRVLALFDKPDPLDGPFFEETIYVTPSRLPAETQEAIARCTDRACQALGLTHGPVHAELRIGNPQASSSPGPRIIEINPRSIGGLCSRVLRFGTGLSLEELIIRQALDADYAPPAREPQPAGVMMIPIPRAGILKEVRGLEAAKAVQGIEQVTISAHLGQALIPLPEGSAYLGFLFARAASPEAVESALREAHARLEFVIEPA